MNLHRNKKSIVLDLKRAEARAALVELIAAADVLVTNFRPVALDEFTYDKVSADRFIVGSPEHCIEEIERWHEELGADYFVMRYRHPAGPDHEKALASMRLFGEKVIPHFA